MELPVLVDQQVWPEFREAIDELGEEWRAPSGRRYSLERTESRLEVLLLLGDLEPPPSGDEIDADLFGLAGEIYDRVGGEWSAEALRGISALWGWEAPGR